MNLPLLNDNITVAEIDLAINEIGTSTGIDVTKLFTQKLKLLLMNFLNKIHGNSYPDIWKEQLLSIKKKGHKKTIQNSVVLLFTQSSLRLLYY